MEGLRTLDISDSDNDNVVDNDTPVYTLSPSHPSDLTLFFDHSLFSLRRVLSLSMTSTTSRQ